MVWDPPIQELLADTRALELAHFAGVDMKHNCNHFWRKDDCDWDQAMLCCTRYEAMPDAAADAIRLAAEQARHSLPALPCSAA